MVALDLAWLAAGRMSATVALSNLPWDVSAGVLLVREAGGLVLDAEGARHSPGLVVHARDHTDATGTASVRDRRGATPAPKRFPRRCSSSAVHRLR